MRVLAVVVTHNRSKLLQRCIKNIELQTKKPDEILIVNNGSTDNTLDVLSNLDVSVISQSNVGSAGGWHTGIKYALKNDFDAVWMMDDDGYPDHRALHHLSSKLSNDCSISCISSLVLREDKKENFVFRLPKLNKNFIPILFGFRRKYRNLKQLSKNIKGDTYPWAHLFNGALIPTSALKNIGNVNSDYFIFGEEVDFFFRLRDRGEVVSHLSAWHYHPDVSKRPYTDVKTYYCIKNTMIIYRKFYDFVLIRRALGLIAILLRVFYRNGVINSIMLVLGSNSGLLYRATVKGFLGSPGKDFNV